MKKALRTSLFMLVVLTMMLGACAPKSTPIETAQPVNTVEPVDTAQPTSAPQPTNTPEPTPTMQPTELPGQVVLPIESLQFGNPWQPFDRSKIPTVVYYGFDVNKPPFNVPEVRQAFAAALDTEILTRIYSESPFYNDEKFTRNVIPPTILSRDLTGEIGIQYDPAKAKELLASAGYVDPTTFPETNLLIVYPVWADYPGIMVNAAKEAIKMWKDNLGVTVNMEVVGVETGGVEEQLALIKSGKYQIFEHGVWVGSNDPNDLVSSMFYSDGANNLTGFNNARAMILIDDGLREVDPAKRLPIYIELEKLLSEEEMPIIPIFHCTVDGSSW